MGIFSMLARSILSYTIFLASRKIVRGGVSFGDNFKKNMKLHRCENCWRLYSGEIADCTFCGERTTALYNIYYDDDYGPYENPEEFENDDKRDGLERQVYNDSSRLKFEPLKKPTLEVQNDRHRSRKGAKPGGSNQGRDSKPPRYVNDNRKRGHSNSRRDSKLG